MRAIRTRFAQLTLDWASFQLHDEYVIAEVLFDRVQHLIRVPVKLAGDTYRFLVDTGIGVTVVSNAVAARSDVQPTGETFAAQRMSGQVVEVPLVRLPSVDLVSGSRLILSPHSAERP